MALANGAHRALVAIGLAAVAHRGAQIHQTLGVLVHGLHPAPLGQQGMGVLVQVFLRRGQSQVFIKGQQPGQHPAHIAVHDGHRLTKTQ